MRIGLVGAGAWAERMHAPALDGARGVRFAGVWTRRRTSAVALADRFGVAAPAEFDELLDISDAVAFAVPPAAQPALAVRAALAGRAVLLEKPLAADLAGAQRIADAVERAGVVSQVVLPARYGRVGRDFVECARRIGAFSGAGVWVSGRAGAGSWRADVGPLLDIGPHVVDLLDATLGSIIDVRAASGRAGSIGLLFRHDGGAVSVATLCWSSPGARPEHWVSVQGTDGSARLDFGAIGDDAPAAMLDDFVAAVRSGQSPAIDARHGTRLQAVIDDAAQQVGKWDREPSPAHRLRP